MDRKLNIRRLDASSRSVALARLGARCLVVAITAVVCLDMTPGLAADEVAKYIDLDQQCRNCHDENNPRPPRVRPGRDMVEGQWVKQDAFDTWQMHDLHSMAGLALSNDLGKAILAKLPATARGACLRCHATPQVGTEYPPPSDPEDKYRLPSDLKDDDFDDFLGVSCQACHGPASEWWQPHVNVEQPGVWRLMTSEEKESYLGFFDMRNPVTRARICTSCHVGNVAEGKIVTHEMYVAGHPPLSGFEMQGFLESMPHHWWNIREKEAVVQQQQKDAQLWDREVLNDAQASLVGSAATLKAALDSLGHHAHEAVAGQAAWPELGTLDCFACHHDLRHDTWRRDRERITQRGGSPHDAQLMPGRPGLPTWARAVLLNPTVLAELVKAAPDAESAAKLQAAADTLAQTVHDLDASYRDRPFGDPELVADRSQTASAAADTLLAELRKLRLDEPQAKSLAAALQAALEAGPLPFDDARVLAWTLDQLNRDAEAAYGASPLAHPQVLDDLQTRLVLGFPDRGRSVEQRVLPESSDAYNWLQIDSLLRRSLEARSRYESSLRSQQQALQALRREGPSF